MTRISLKKLIEAGAHFGHQTKRWDPRMEEYIYGAQDGVHVFDLTKTKKMLEEALDAMTKAVSEGETILFLGTKKQAKKKTRQVAEETGMPFVDERWLGGTLTNFGQMKKSIEKLKEMKEGREKGEYKHLTKKERLLIDREIERLERFFGGISSLEEKPEMLFVVDAKREEGAIKEAEKEGVGTVAIVDSNSDPTSVDYPIPMNDDATQAIEYVLELVGEAVKEGKSKKTKEKKKADKKEEKKLVKKLREKTGAPIVRVKEVLEEEGDVKKAEKILKKEGFEKASKRKERETSQGVIETYVHHSGKVASVVELLSETDFVARNKVFRDLAHDLALQIASMGAKDAEDLKKQDFIRDPKKKVGDLVKEAIAKTGENIRIGRVFRIELGE
jgi:small subunit ribosomal protein S2